MVLTGMYQNQAPSLEGKVTIYCTYVWLIKFTLRWRDFEIDGHKYTQQDLVFLYECKGHT